jgi:hypothetical protein
MLLNGNKPLAVNAKNIYTTPLAPMDMVDCCQKDLKNKND